MAKLVLHIGTHKTATTTIQDCFARNADLLATHGLIYPRLNPASGHHGMVMDWVGLPLNYAIEGGSLAAMQGLAQRYGAQEGTVLLSSEEFSRAASGGRVDFAALRQAAAGFSRIEVVCLLREQWQFLQSVYLEISRYSQSPPPAQWVAGLLATDMAQGLWADYTRLYADLLQVFAADEIRFFSYADWAAAPEGVVGRMLAYLGVDLAVADLEMDHGGRSNVSAPPLASWAANVIAHPMAAAQGLVAACAGALMVEYGEDRPSLLWQRDEMARLLDYGAARNAALTRAVIPHQPDFALPPCLPPANAVYREDINSSFWCRAARWIHRDALARGVA